MTARPWLPQVLFEVAERFDLATALKFADVYGGKRLYIPQQAGPEHPIAATFGAEILEWLVARWGGAALLVPLGPASSYTRRVAEIRRMLQAGEDSATIIRAVGCHERTLTRHRKALKDTIPGGDGRQKSFDF